MTEYIQVVTTVETREQAEKIAEEVLGSRLAACVQISRCHSRYRWQGTLEQADEYLCCMKSRRDLFEGLQILIRGQHPYDVPEILAIPVVEGNKEYLAWLEKELLPG
ncbi:MAG TPA: divalent-cation tolerance protein CutA [Desulfobulbus sp.]|nr:divalent-cation tolerance protein CutA [Desulfobulbus sp.]